MTAGSALAFTARDKVELVGLSLPAIRDDEALVQTEITAVSQGTDRAMIAGTYRGAGDRYPFIYGYSRVGTVTAAGSEVAEVSPGDRVFVGMSGTRLDPADGFGESGGSYTSHAVVHRSEMVRLPADADPVTASLGGIAAIAYQGVVSAGIRPGSRVLVAGLGAVGQFSTLLSTLRGAQVWASDLAAPRRALAAQISGAIPLDPGGDLAAQIADSAWGTRPWRGRNGLPRSAYEQQRWAAAGGAVDVVIDATGRPDALEAYLPLLAREGCLCLQGYYGAPLSLDFHAAHMKRLTIRCPGGYDLADYETVLRLMSAADISGLVGAVIPAADAPGRLHDLLFSGSPDVVAAVIDWRAAARGKQAA